MVSVITTQIYLGNIKQKQTAKNGVEGLLFSVDYWRTYQLTVLNLKVMCSDSILRKYIFR